ncbi:MAG: hypothetical protein Q8918_01165 [Bacteroidota bacterium]|nr:hypothetical protein [Bacteroidota bacterium]
MQLKFPKLRLAVLRRKILIVSYRGLGFWNARLQPKEVYCLKRGYHSAHMPKHLMIP